MRIRVLFLTILFATFFHNVSFSKTDKYRCIWRDDPATTMTIAWNQLSGTNPVVYYDVVDRGTDAAAYTFQHKPDRKIWAKGMHNHFARLTGLMPNTAYYFIIKDSDSVSKKFWFKTAPNHDYDRLSIVAGGDSRNYWEGRRNANKIVSKLRPDCVVFGGDMTGSDNTTQWRRWMNDWQLTITEDGKMTPIIPARGNHEYSNNSIINLFDAPSKNIYYALTFGQSLLRVYTLNTLIATNGTQAQWLENDLKQHEHITWRMAQYHYPIRPHTAKKSERNTQYKAWAKLFYDHKVQVVVECDAHVCKTTWPIRPSYEKGHDEGFVRDDVNGTVYIGEGCWGAPLRPDDDDKKWTRNSGSFNQVKWLFVDNDKIEIRTVKTDNPDKVEALTENDKFRMPKNINLWKPSNGSVITINRRLGIADVDTKPIPKPTKIAEKPIEKPKTTKEKTTTATVAVAPKPVPKKTVPATPKVSVEKTLQLLDFDAALDKQKVAISWKTKAEPEQTTCEIQRSTNGFDFITIANIPGVGTTDMENLYRIKDETLDYSNTPFVFYRLRHIYSDGAIQNSNKKKVNVTDWANFNELPVDNENKALYLEYKLTRNTDVTVIIYDKKGDFVFQRVYLNQVVGDQLKKIELPNVESGEYLLGIETDGRERWYWRINM